MPNFFAVFKVSRAPRGQQCTMSILTGQLFEAASHNAVVQPAGVRHAKKFVRDAVLPTR